MRSICHDSTGTELNMEDAFRPAMKGGPGAAGKHIFMSTGGMCEYVTNICCFQYSSKCEPIVTEKHDPPGKVRRVRRWLCAGVCFSVEVDPTKRRGVNSKS